ATMAATRRRNLLGWQWPLYFLLFYVIYPEPHPVTAVFTLLLVLAIYGLGWVRRCPPKVPILLTAVSFAILYIATLAPDILPADNGEFQVVAANLGVAHPPGFSLYTIIAHLFARLPLATSPAYKVNLFSAITSVLTLILVHLTVYRLTKRHDAGLTAVFTLGTATTFWAQATTANIRSLTGLFAALMIYALVRFKEETENLDNVSGIGIPDTRWLPLFTLALGFGVTHHASLIFMGLIFVIFALAVDFSLIKQPTRWIRPFLAGLFGLLPLLYFPLRAGADARGAELGLATANGFLNHVLALGFRGDMFHFVQPDALWRRFQVMGNVLTFQFSPWLLAGTGVGLFLLLRRDRKLAVLLGGSFALHTVITATYRAPQTVEYMLPAYVPLVVMLGYAVGSSDGQRFKGKMTVVFTALMFTIAIYQGWQRYPSYAFLHQDKSTRSYTQPLLEDAPPDAVILADWHWATPLWYLQEVEGLRPDVNVRFVFPEGELYADTWARRIREEWENGRSVIATHFDSTAYAGLPIPEPMGEAYLFRQEPPAAMPADFTPLDLILNDAIHILGYRLQDATVEIGQETTLTIAWQSLSSSPESLALFAHLVGHDGRLAAQDDLNLTPHSNPSAVNLAQFRLTPRLGVPPGDFAIMLGAPEDSAGRTTVAALTVAAMSRPPVTQNPVYRTVPSGRPLLRFIGYDWDNTLPDHPRLYLHWQTEQGYQTEIRDDFDASTMPVYFGPWGVIRNQWSAVSNQSNSYYVPLGQGIVWGGQPFPLSPISNP
ncbi:MAG: DUF2723 domain-containing protein, partial [Chloroflexi bacterium]|nr:DUF2723 domain-containing protein [Chloroflexota bacterium]